MFGTSGRNSGSSPYWNEISFTATGAAETMRRLDDIDARLDAMLWRLDELENRICALIAQEQAKNAAAIQSES